MATWNLQQLLAENAESLKKVAQVSKKVERTMMPKHGARKEARVLRAEENLLDQPEDRTYQFGVPRDYGPGTRVQEAPVIAQTPSGPSTAQSPPSNFIKTPTGGIHLPAEQRGILPAETMQQVADYRKGLGAGAQTEFTNADIDPNIARGGSYAGSREGGGTFSTTPAFDPKVAQTQANNAVMRKWLSMDPSERGPAPGSAAAARRSALSRAPMAPTATSPWERRNAMRNAAVGAPSDWDRRHMTDSQYKTATAAHQAGIARVADRFADEDEQATIQNVARIRADETGGPDMMDQIAMQRLGLDVGRAAEQRKQNTFERQMEESKVGREQDEAFDERLGQAVSTYALPSWGEDLLREFGGNPMAMGARIRRILDENPEIAEGIETRGSYFATDETDKVTRENAMADLRQKLQG